MLSSRVGEHGQVVACEPNPIAFQISKQYLRHCKNTILLNMGMGGMRDSVQILTMQGPADGAASACASSKNNYLTIFCNFTTVDHLIAHLQIKKLDKLVIDVEGGEVEVLEGSVETLTSMKPEILVELHPEVRVNVVKQVVDKLNTHGFRGTVFSVDSKTVTYLFKPTR